ncbi:DNA-binding transcriptional regulator, CsgD family [Octadecabacter temperatus]|uniref:Alpha/beta hydrolase family protein n=1 Tax=Octadecabacter temperatus TaxID=1458307 RepID=A0A0K0Y462_9RHOB|nr:helix-turn-helix transcriptional regulator [Octadecabacter temperatus]AKS45672.1 Alpha/beta hydrolase family protein [Octadecabacter temperatus]SIN98042.1 DNA-binding transcriptional regulator, CsgD family [Octadecabacter temperatus]
MGTDEKPAAPHSTANTNEMIDRLYEVAVDPSRYEALLDHWEAMIGPERLAAHKSNTPIIGLEHLTGHVERADQVLDRVLRDDFNKGPRTIIDQIDHSAAFAVDRSLTIIAANAGATQLLHVQHGNRLQDAQLGEGDTDQLAHHIGRLLNLKQDEPVVLRGHTAQGDRLIVFHMRVIRTDDSEPYVLILSSDIHWPDGFSEMLRAAFDLTPAESQVVRALTEGNTLQQAAEIRGRSVDTIRAQLKSIMAKTETRSQTELVRLTLSTMEIAQFTTQVSEKTRAISQGYDTLPPRPFQTFTLEDGRRMDYLILGDPFGAPLVYSPLDYGLVRWPAKAEVEAARLGIKVIVPVRAGYGKSDPIPKRTPYVPQLCDDLAALMTHVGVEAAPMLTLGGDTHLACQFNQLHEGRVTALIACAGVLPLTRAEQYDRMDKWHRFILAGARYTPHLLPFMVKAGFALAKRLGKYGFLQAVYGKSDADMAAVANQDVFEALVVGSEVCLSETHSAHDAFAREVIAHETTEWTDSVLALKGSVPVIMMNGLQDPQVPAETLAEFRRDYPWITFDVFPDAGQLLFFAKWPQVLERLQQFLNKT